jgi:hypothetical protein
MGYIVRGLKMFHKAVAVAGTAEPLVASTKYVWKVKIKALAANAGVVYLGDSSVSSADGYELAAGEEIDILELTKRPEEIFDLAEVYVDAANNGDAVAVIYAD